VKPRLLITASTLPNAPSDPEPRFIVDLARSLDRHFEVCVVAPLNPEGTPHDSSFGVEVRRYRYAPFRAWETLAYPGAILDRLRENRARWGLVPLLFAGLFREVRQLNSERNFDCVHAHWMVPQAFVQAVASGRDRSPPFIAVAQGADIHATNGPITRQAVKFAISRASGVITASDDLRQRLLHRFPGEMAGLPTDVVGTGVDTDKFSPVRRSEDWPSTLGLSHPLICFFGRLSEKKGVEVLLMAMAREPLRALHASVVIVGQGLRGNALRQLAYDLGINDRLRFLPAASHEMLPAYVASSDVVCVPSVSLHNGDREGRPTVLVEAAACGIASVASDSGGVGDWIDHGSNGLLVPQGDATALSEALAAVLRKPDRLREMGRLARTKALKYSWQAVGDRYAELTWRILDRCPSSDSIGHQAR